MRADYRVALDACVLRSRHSDDRGRLVLGTLDREPIVNSDLHLGMELAVQYENVKEHMSAEAFNQ